MKRSKIINIMLSGTLVLSSIFFVGCGNKDKADVNDTEKIQGEVPEMPNFENMTDEERKQFDSNRPDMPDFENMTDEERKQFEGNRPQMPDFENMTDEEKAEFEKNMKNGEMKPPTNN